MSGFLLDTNVLAKLAPNKVENSILRNWVSNNFNEIYISVITVAEIEAGIAKLQRQGATQKAQILRDWLEITIVKFDSRIIIHDLEAARLTGVMHEKANSLGKNIGFADSALAAICKHHSLKLLTFNLKDFEGLEIEYVKL